jgi:hypothetical protein
MTTANQKPHQADTQPTSAGRSRGLSVVTNLPASNAADNAKHSEASQRLTNGSFGKPTTGHAVSTRRTSNASQNTASTQADNSSRRAVGKALLNDDWRHKWRPDGKADEKKSENLQARSKVAKRNLRIDTVTALMNNGPTSRYRDASDSSLDRDFIVSAPATNQELHFVEEKDDDHPSKEAGSDQLSLGLPIHPTDKPCLDSGFPSVQIQAVENGKGLQPQRWREYERRILEKLARSMIPRPATKAEEEVEKHQKFHGVRELLNSVTSDNETTKPSTGASLHHGPFEEDKFKEWNAVVAKINKKPADSCKVSGTNIVTQKTSEPQLTDNLNQGEGDSVAPCGRRASVSTLNPRANEFLHNPPEMDPRPIIYPSQPDGSLLRPPMMGASGNMMGPAQIQHVQAQQSEELALRNAICSLEAHLLESTRQQHANTEYLLNHLQQLYQRLRPMAPLVKYPTWQDGAYPTGVGYNLTAGNDMPQLPGPIVSGIATVPGAPIVSAAPVVPEVPAPGHGQDPASAPGQCQNTVQDISSLAPPASLFAPLPNHTAGAVAAPTLPPK